ncbi:MAG: DUF2085 domain-containing protein [Anaerolineae bacterium]|nr:DUF2085 domain-containing protein [Anaerolineae bacterium]
MGSGDLKQEADFSTDDIIAEAEQRLREKDDTKEELTPVQRKILAVMNRWIFWLSKHWLAVFNVIAFLYVGGAILAPVLMHYGNEQLATPLYKFYGPFCHQYPFRSWFLFGEHTHYPQEPAARSVFEMNKLKSFVGNAEMGYKMALCERCIGIYSAIFIAGLIYGLLRRRIEIKILPIWLYFVIGIVPMGLDGGLQWVSYILWTLKLIPAPYETTAFMRTLTGILFGIGAIGVAYPSMEMFFKDIYNTLSQRYNWT